MVWQFDTWTERVGVGGALAFCLLLIGKVVDTLMKRLANGKRAPEESTETLRDIIRQEVTGVLNQREAQVRNILRDELEPLKRELEDNHRLLEQIQIRVNLLITRVRMLKTSTSETEDQI